MYVFKGSKLGRITNYCSGFIIKRVHENVNKPVLIIGTDILVECDYDGTIYSVIPRIARLPNLNRFFKDYEIYIVFFDKELVKIDPWLVGKGMIEWIKENFKTREVILIGHSIMGLCFYDAAYTLNRNNVNLITIATPFRGLHIFNAQELQTKNGRWLYNEVFKRYRMISSIERDSNYIKYIIRLARKKIVFRHMNIESVLYSYNNCKTFKEKLYYWINSNFYIYGNGVVSSTSQRLPKVRSALFYISHASILQKALDAGCVQELYCNDQPWSM